MDPVEAVEKNALLKGEAVEKRIGKYPILSSDCIVVLDGKIYGKPKDLHDAVRILSELSGKWHEVITATCLVGSPEFKKTRIQKTRVKIKNLSKKQILEYVKANKKILEHAGAYAIQFNEYPIVEGYKGEFANVVGLSIEKTKELLKELEEFEKKQARL